MSPRQIAKDNGDMFYEGSPCKKAGHTMRYTSKGECVRCHTDRPGSRQLRQIAKDNGEDQYITRCKPCNEDTLHWTRSAGCVKCTSESAKWAKIKYTYGISKDEWFWMYKEQYGKCDMCKKVLKIKGNRRGRAKLIACVDHDHKTNKIRGLLCASCNSLIGLAEENVSILQSGIEYLTKNGMG